MSLSPKLLAFSVLLILSLITIFDFSQLPMTKQSAHPRNLIKIALSENTFDFKSNQMFSGAAGSTIEYNLYIENTRKSIASYTLTGLSNRDYYIEVWRDTDQIGSGETQLLPPQGSSITLNAGEVATLIVKVSIPPTATSGTVDTTTIRLVDSTASTSKSVTVTTIVNPNLPYPSNWIQLGSDPTFPTPPPERIDIKAVYYTNNGTYVFFRTAEVSRPYPASFFYCMYLDTKPGGQQIESYSYDYMLSSDGVLHEWDGLNWIASGYQTYWQIDGTSMVLWADLNNLDLEMQEIHFLSQSTTKDYTRKDEVGPFTVLRNNISEIPLILIPVLSFGIYFTISRRTRKNARKHEYVL